MKRPWGKPSVSKKPCRNRNLTGLTLLSPRRQAKMSRHRASNNHRLVRSSRRSRILPPKRTLQEDPLVPGVSTPPAWRSHATEEQKRIGWEMAVRIEKILCPVLHEAHQRQVEETTNTLSEEQ